MSDAPVAPPLISVQRVLKQLNKLNEALHPLHGYRYSGSSFDDFVHKLHAALPATVPYSTLYDTVSHYAGTDILDKEVYEIAWRLAGNVHRLVKGHIIPPWTTQTELEWAPMQILSVHPCLKTYKAEDGSEYTKAGAFFNTMILGGSAAGLNTSKFFPKTYLLSAGTKKLFGFEKYDKSVFKRDARPEKSWPLRDVMEYTRARFYGKLDPELSKEYPGYEKMRCGPAFIEFNRILAQRRQRLTFQCPLNYDVRYRPCYLCEKGYNGEKGCKAACHPVDYALLKCPECSKNEQYFDPQTGMDSCVDCKKHVSVK